MVDKHSAPAYSIAGTISPLKPTHQAPGPGQY